ncbi:hypothetical protein BH09PSE2_BH09PSE2_23050 [soil metagenome]
MYAVIQTGGRQYRVRAGDVIVVEKLEGDVGSEVSFDRVLMMGGGEGGVTIGAPAIEGALVSATLIETRKGEKIKVFKKIRRQGYRRTQGHRQFETVLRITGLEGLGQSMKWEGTVDLTPRSVINARARGLAPMVTTPEVLAQPVTAPVQAEAAPAPKKAKAPKAPTEAQVEQPISETPATGAQTDVDAAASTETGSMASEETVAAAAPKKPKAPKAPKASPAGDAE